MKATRKAVAAQAARMKISQWLTERVSSHDICNAKGVAQDFKRLTGYEPVWDTITVAEARQQIKARGIGGQCEGPDDERVVGGYVIAVQLAKHFVSQFRSLKSGRGSMYWEAVEALKGAGY